METSFILPEDKNLTQFEKDFERLEGSFPENAVLAKLRSKAFAEFTALGFPTLAHEEWKYTNVSPLAKMAFTSPMAGGSLPTLSEVDALFLPKTQGPRLTFVNGRFQKSLSRVENLENGLTVESMREIFTSGSEEKKNDLAERHLAQRVGIENQAFVSLNTAFFEDGAVVRIAKGTQIKGSLQILFLNHFPESSAGPFVLVAPRVLIIAESGSQVTVVETHRVTNGSAQETYLSCGVCEVVVEENAHVEHIKVQTEGESAYHFSTVRAYQKQNSTFHSFLLSLGGKLTRHDIQSCLQGEGAESVLNGVYVGGRTQHMDQHTVIDHAMPHCRSRELYKGVLGGHARGVFNGKVIVRPDAQKTNAIQANRTLLLSKDASVDTKPELQIFADDVKCTHGATIGQLDDEALFYLRARGISVNECRTILMKAFVGEVVQTIRFDGLGSLLEPLLFSKLSQVVAQEG